MENEQEKQRELKLRKEIREEERLIELLRRRIGHKVKLALLVQTKAEELGSMVEPQTTKEEYLIAFLGIFGFTKRYGFIGKRPLYIYGKDKNDEDMLFRNNLDITLNEDNGVVNYECVVEIISLDKIDVKRFFSCGSPIEEDKKNLSRRIAASRQGIGGRELDSLVKELLKGTKKVLGYWAPSYSVFTRKADPEFINAVLRYFEKIF